MSGFRPILVIGSMMVLVGLVGLLMTKQGNANGAQSVELSSEAPICAPREDNPQRTILPIGATEKTYSFWQAYASEIRTFAHFILASIVVSFLVVWYGRVE